jgi:uncharacterized protein (TIGR02284 family)
MTRSPREVITTLNELIETAKDGELGFQTAADAVTDAELKRLLVGYARQRGEFATQLRDEVQRLGGRPEESGSVAGSLHRGWMSLKAALTGHGEEPIISAVERGEDSARTAYEKTLQQDLPGDVRALVERQYAGIRESHERVRFLRRAA